MTPNKKKRRQGKAWFQAFGWLHLPVTWEGALVAAAALGFCLSVFLLIDTHVQSFGELFYALFPYLACSFLMVEWIAGKTSHKSGK